MKAVSEDGKISEHLRIRELWALRFADYLET